MRRLIGIVLTLFALLCSMVFADDGEDRDSVALSAEQTDLLNSMMKNFSEGIDSAGVDSLRILAMSGSDVVRALAALQLYATDTAAYKKLLFESFAVHDYVDRSEGIYNMIEMPSMLEVARSIEESNAKLKDKRLFPLLVFVWFRDRNEWMQMDEQKLSAARFFRGTVFGLFLQDAGVNALQLSTRIDKETQEADLRD